MPRMMAESILAAHGERGTVEPGELLSVGLDSTTANTSPHHGRPRSHAVSPLGIERTLNMPAIWATYGPPDQDDHLPNENMTLKPIFDGIRASVLVLQRFAAMPKSDIGRRPRENST